MNNFLDLLKYILRIVITVFVIYLVLSLVWYLLPVILIIYVLYLLNRSGIINISKIVKKIKNFFKGNKSKKEKPSNKENNSKVTRQNTKKSSKVYEAEIVKEKDDNE